MHQFLPVAKNAINSEPSSFILAHFDTFFWIVEHASEVHMMTLIRSSDLLYHIVDQLGNSLTQILQKSEISSPDRISTLNATKMLAYVQIQTVKAIDKIMKAANDSVMKKGRKVYWINFIVLL